MDTCTAKKPDGAPCTRPTVLGGAFCSAHDPVLRAQGNRTRAANKAERVASSVSAGSHSSTTTGKIAEAAASKGSGAVDPAAQKKIHAMLMGSLGFGAAFMPAPYAPTQKELNEILLPLERIALRRVPQLSEVSPDTTDALAAAGASLSYVGRVYVESQSLTRAAKRAAPDAARKLTGATGPNATPAQPARPAAAPAGSGEAADSGRSAASGAGAGSRTIEDILGAAHRSSVHAGADASGDDYGGAEG